MELTKITTGGIYAHLEFLIIQINHLSDLKQKLYAEISPKKKAAMWDDVHAQESKLFEMGLFYKEIMYDTKATLLEGYVDASNAVIVKFGVKKS